LTTYTEADWQMNVSDTTFTLVYVNMKILSISYGKLCIVLEQFRNKKAKEQDILSH
jgi:hypothetical protein